MQSSETFFSTHVHRHSSQRLSAPKIVQAHCTIATTARENARFTLVERDAGNVLARRQVGSRVELES